MSACGVHFHLQAPQGCAFKAGERADTCAQSRVCTREYRIRPVQQGLLSSHPLSSAGTAGQPGAVQASPFPRGVLGPRHDGNRRVRSALLQGCEPDLSGGALAGSGTVTAGNAGGEPAQGFRDPLDCRGFLAARLGLPPCSGPSAARRAAGEASFPRNKSCPQSHLFLGL